MNNQGISSFLLDCHTNDDIAEIEADFGIKGFAVIVRLWQKIYAENGYYCEWIERSPLLFLSQWFGGNSGVDLNLINDVVARAVKLGIFDKGLFEKYSILTSARIQENYLMAVKRRTTIKVISEYLLVSVANFKVTVDTIEKNVCKNEKNVYRNSTSKSKVNKTESKVCTEEQQAEPAHTPLKKTDYDSLCEKYGKQKVDEYIKKTSNPKYKNCCNAHTIERWIIEDMEKKQSGAGQNNSYRNGFHDFPQRNYSSDEMREIEKKLLEKTYET